MSAVTLEPEVVPTSGKSVKVWDPIVRLFHWTVVAGCFLNLFVFEDGKAIHRYIGYTVAGVLVIRVLWGFVGTRHARFSDFVPRPAQLVTYLKALLRGEEPRYLGHNPAGALMMLGLMALLAAVSATGWMMTLDANFGSEELEEVHEVLANTILVAAALHAVAAIVQSMRQRENLVWSMITGRKRS